MRYNNTNKIEKNTSETVYMLDSMFTDKNGHDTFIFNILNYKIHKNCVL